MSDSPLSFNNTRSYFLRIVVVVFLRSQIYAQKFKSHTFIVKIFCKKITQGPSGPTINSTPNTPEGYLLINPWVGEALPGVPKKKETTTLEGLQITTDNTLLFNNM